MAWPLGHRNPAESPNSVIQAARIASLPVERAELRRGDGLPARGAESRHDRHRQGRQRLTDLVRDLVGEELAHGEMRVFQRGADIGDDRAAAIDIAEAGGPVIGILRGDLPADARRRRFGIGAIISSEVSRSGETSISFISCAGRQKCRPTTGPAGRYRPRSR